MTVSYRLITNVQLLGGSRTIKAYMACWPVLDEGILLELIGQKKKTPRPLLDIDFLLGILDFTVA
jgi:hypothetical protein